MRKNLIRTSIIICVAWFMASCHAMIDHSEEKKLTISFDSSGEKRIREITRKNTHVDVEYKGEVNIEVFKNGWFKM